LDNNPFDIDLRRLVVHILLQLNAASGASPMRSHVIGTGAALMVLGTLAGSAAIAQQPGAAGGSQPSPTQIQRPLPLRKLPPTQPAGSPALAPHLKGTPSFTLDDVKQFVANHQLLKPANRDGVRKLVSAEFMSSSEVSSRLNGATTGFPDDYTLCVVELQGPFSFAGPAGATAVYPRGVLVFDATTGNLVIAGGMP
jgi:hypothetical protein